MTIDIRTLFDGLEELDKKFVDAFIRALKNNHIKEFDYIKFKKSVNTLIGMDMDQTTAFKSAFATAATLGITKDKLIKTANHYKNVLSKEQSEFAEALKNQQKQKVGGKREEAKKMKSKIEEYKAKIKQMEEEMAVYQKKIDSTDNEIAKAEQKLVETRDKFVNALGVFTNQIDKDLELIELYL
jgi:chromosome segregation ATPase